MIMGCDGGIGGGGGVGKLYYVDSDGARLGGSYFSVG